MASNDSVENFIEEVTLLPGWLTRNLFVMRFLDQQVYEIELSLSEKKKKYLVLLKKYEEDRKVRKLKKVADVLSTSQNENIETIGDIVKTENIEDDEDEKKRHQQIDDNKAKLILGDELNDILNLQKSVKRLLKEKIQTASQCIHFVRYEFEHLKVEYDKLQKGIDENGCIDTMAGGDTSNVSTRKQQSGRHGTAGSGSSVVGNNININNIASSNISGRVAGELLSSLGGEAGDINVDNKGRSRVNSDIGGGSNTTRKSNNNRDCSARNCWTSNGLKLISNTENVQNSNGRVCKRSKKSVDSTSDVQSNVAINQQPSNNVANILCTNSSNNNQVLQQQIHQQNGNVGGMTIRMASSRLQEDRNSSKLNVDFSSATLSSSAFNLNVNNTGDCIMEKKSASNVGSMTSSRSSARNHHHHQTDISDNPHKKQLYSNQTSNNNIVISNSTTVGSQSKDMHETNHVVNRSLGVDRGGGNVNSGNIGRRLSVDKKNSNAGAGNYDNNNMSNMNNNLYNSMNNNVSNNSNNNRYPQDNKLTKKCELMLNISNSVHTDDTGNVCDSDTRNSLINNNNVINNMNLSNNNRNIMNSNNNNSNGHNNNSNNNNDERINNNNNVINESTSLNNMEANNHMELDSVCPICRDGEGVDTEGNERPMVGCDACDEWFHFDCVRYIPPSDGDEQSNFYCPPCITQGRVPLSEIQKISHINMLLQSNNQHNKSKRR